MYFSLNEPDRVDTMRIVKTDLNSRAYLRKGLTNWSKSFIKKSVVLKISVFKNIINYI